MIMYVVTILIFVGIIVNYALGNLLYKEPTNDAYFSNISHYNIINKKDIMASPKYVLGLSAVAGILIGLYLLLCELSGVNNWVKWITVLVLVALYLTEITRKVSLTDENLEMEATFLPSRKIPLNKIDGMYVYSYTKKFLNKRALTTKLVVSSGNKRYKFTLSSIDVKAIINMMKENFGITENKMYIAKK